MEYEDMLEKARNSLPEAVFTAERFEIPKVVGHVEGNKTVISNFPQIVSVLRRELQHVLKFILKELATPGEMRRNDLILGRKLSASMINEKIVKYARTFVLCVECGKPDTQIIKEEEITYLKCQACGAKHPVKSKI